MTEFLQRQWAEWSTYELIDFLMFSPQVYFRLFETQNAALWPAPALALLFGMAVLVLWQRQFAHAARAACLLLALAWLSVGWNYFSERYAEIHLAGHGIAVACLLQAVLLGARAVSVSTPLPVQGGRAMAARLLFLAALLAWPLQAGLLGRPWMQAEIVGFAPDPTALATLALLLALPPPRWPFAVLPLLWLAFSAASLWSMEERVSAGWSAIAAALSIVLFAVYRMKRLRKSGL